MIIRIALGQIDFITADATHSDTFVRTVYATRNGVSVAANMRNALAEYQFADSEKQRATILLDAPLMIVPLEEYNAEESSVLFDYTFTEIDSATVIDTVMPSENAVALMAVNNDLQRVMDDNFQEVVFVPLMQSLWRFMHKRSFSGTSSRLYVYLHENAMEVCAFRHVRFRYQNVFLPASAADACYYLMNIWQQLGMKADTDELVLFGDNNLKTDLQAQLAQFLKNVKAPGEIAEFNAAVMSQTPMPLDVLSYLSFGR